MKEKDPSKRLEKLLDRMLVPPDREISLDDHDPGEDGGLKDKKRAERLLADGIRRLARQQEMLYAQDTHALLLIFQAMDAAGKDGTIQHVMSGINPQGCQVFSFKAPSAEERDHDYLWRSMRVLPERGRIGIHNRSYYEEVLVARVHPEILQAQQLPPERKTKKIWKERFEQINHFERYLSENGITVMKFFLNVSKAEQKRRFLERIDTPEKNWKFSLADVHERARWSDYRKAYEEVLSHTSTKWAPWYIIPADHKAFLRLAVAELIHRTLAGLDLSYPRVNAARKRELRQARAMLLAEKE